MSGLNIVISCLIRFEKNKPDNIFYIIRTEADGMGAEIGRASCRERV